MPRRMPGLRLACWLPWKRNAKSANHWLWRHTAPCTFSTTPVTLTENTPSKPSVLHIWKRISSDQCNPSPSERICIKSYLDTSTNCKALYKTTLCDKKSKLPLSSLLGCTCSILSLCLFPRHSFVLQSSWVYSVLPPLTHTGVWGR